MNQLRPSVREKKILSEVEVKRRSLPGIEINDASAAEECPQRLFAIQNNILYSGQKNIA
jgi:hypothetical protein